MQFCCDGHTHETDQLAVAERSRVPLYTVSAGILGSSPEDVETSLDYALDLCRMWNAMLLLDEADVFLGARTDEGISRNELVSSTRPDPRSYAV